MNQELANRNARSAALGDELRTVRLGRSLDLDRLSESLCGLLGGDIGAIYAPRVVNDSYELDFVHGAGIPRERLRRGFEAVLPRSVHRASEGDPGARHGLDALIVYDPLRPESWQRNRAVSMEGLQRRTKVDSAGYSLVCREEVGVGDLDQVRVLVCEGASLLAWVGCFRSQLFPFGRDATKILQGLAPALAERLAFEAQLRRAGVAEAALDLALGVFDGPALVVDKRGDPVFANRHAEELINRQPRETRERIHDAQAGQDSHYRRFSVGGAGITGHALLVARVCDDDASARVANASSEWNLTPRERQVLAHAVRGLTNAAIGRELNCAERTVELHMTHIMAKAGVGCRAELVAHFWALR